jgi:hypothetical protein
MSHFLCKISMPSLPVMVNITREKFARNCGAELFRIYTLQANAYKIAFMVVP